MPRYTFKCNSCSNEFTVFGSISDSEYVCDKCMSLDLKKIFKLSEQFNDKEEIAGVLTKEHINDLKEQLEDIKNETKNSISK